MTEKGRIREIRLSHVTVIPESESECFGCMKTECKGKIVLIEAENSLSLPLETGQVVEITAPAASLFKQAVTSLMPPVMGFSIGYILTRFFFPGAGEGIAALAGIILLFTAAFIVFAATRKKSGVKIFTVTKILD